MGCNSSSRAKEPEDKKQGTAPAKAPDAPKTTVNKTDSSVKQSASGKKGGDDTCRDVLGKFSLVTSRENKMGEGTSSICYKGTEKASGDEVGIKIYKDSSKEKNAAKQAEITLTKFKRQIKVLQELLEPFKKPDDPAFWHSQLDNLKPESVFMVLIDYSKKAGTQEPGPDANDGVLYVVTELGQYSLKDFLAQRREQNKPLSKESVQNIARAVVLAMAALHSKGLVHLDMKPENMMMFKGRLKVIDVDGCIKTGVKVSISDSTISFSPCYCAPEWARFLIDEVKANILSTPLLDSWSVGMTLCEMVTLDAILKPNYGNFLRNAHSHREAGFLFMEWLGCLKKVQLPRPLVKYEPEFLKVLQEGLLVCDQSGRKSCAQVLDFPYLSGQGSQAGGLQGPDMNKDTQVERQHPRRPEDDSGLAPLHKGTLWKLNFNGDPKNSEHWIKRDMWIAHNHSLCYYSQKEGKKLVLIDAVKLGTAIISKSDGNARACSFEVKTESEQDDGRDTMGFAAESEEELKAWMQMLKQAAKMDLLVTMKLGKQMEDDLKEFRLNVRNRRLKIEDGDHASYEPVLKNLLWKVKAEGDRTKGEDWFQRDMWIAKNGCMVYFSQKENRELVYYTNADFSRCSTKPIPKTDSFYPWTFQVILEAHDGVEFAPGEFAAESEDVMNKWMAKINEFANKGK
jgi:serine/threonine protein kinase